MTLLFLISSLDRGGAETHLITLAIELAHRGHSVTVISSGGALCDHLAMHGISHVSLPLNSRSPLRIFRSHRNLKRLLCAKSYDLIHAHSRIPAFLIHGIAHRIGIPLVTTVHAKFRTTFFLRRMSRWGNYSISVSEDLKQYLCEQYDLCSERITVIPNGIDTDYFSPAEKKSVPSSRRLLYLSRLDEDCSDIAFLLCRIAPILHRKSPDLEIVLAGGGTMVPKLQRLAKKINEDANRPFVFVSGHLDDPKNAFLRAHLVLGVSRVALEAMACGAPVILSGNEGFLGILRPNDFARAAASNFCARGEPKATESSLLQSIDELLSMEEDERTKLAAELCALVRITYSIRSVTDATLSVYQKLCQDQQLRRGELVFCGYYGDGNIGDHALLRAAIARAKNQTPPPSLCAITAHGAKDEPLFGIRCIKRMRFFSVLKAIRHAKLLVFGGGTLLQDRTSLRSLCYYTFLLRYAQRHGISCELWANGLSEPKTKLAKRLMKHALLGCQRIGLRDQYSLSLAMELCQGKLTPPPFWEPDLAATTSPANEDRVSFLLRRYRLLREDGALRPYAILAPRGREAVGQIHIFSWWLRRWKAKGTALLFVPFFPKEDSLLCQRLSEEFGGIFARGLSEGDLVGLMQHCQFVAGMRLHSLIFATCAKVPFVGFGTDPKIESYCQEHCGRYWTDDLDEKE